MIKNILCIALLFLAAAVDAQKGIKNFELDLGAFAEIPSHPNVSVKIESGTARLNDHSKIEIGFHGGINYKIRLNEHFKLVTGLSYFLYRQRNERVVSRQLSSEYTVNSHCVLPAVGLRWVYKRISFENGLAYMYFIKRPCSVTVDGYTGSPWKIEAEKKPAGILQSYHKIGLNVTSHVGVYLTLNLIYAVQAYSGSLYSQFYYVPVSGLQVLPGASVALSL